MAVREVHGGERDRVYDEQARRYPGFAEYAERTKGIRAIPVLSLSRAGRRSQMESPIEVVRRFCAAWSDNVGAGELAAFFTDDAVYHNIPLAPVTGREAIAKTISSVHPAWRARHREYRLPRHQHRSQWSGRDDRASGRLQAP